MSKTTILIGTPCYGGLVSHLYMQSVLRLMAEAASWDVAFQLGLLANDSLVPRARNKLFAAFLDNPELTHLFFIDSDIAFEPSAVRRLLDRDVDLAAGRYPLKVHHWPLIEKRAKEGAVPLAEAGLTFVGLPDPPTTREEKAGFVTGTYAGTGFMLIKRIVAERMIAAYPETHFKAMQTYPPDQNQSPNLYNLFDCQIDPESGVYLSEDYTFCRRWRALGGKIWLDQETRLTHVGGGVFSGTPNAFRD
jgi:hypothetical protein